MDLANIIKADGFRMANAIARATAEPVEPYSVARHGLVWSSNGQGGSHPTAVRACANDFRREAASLGCPDEHRPLLVSSADRLDALAAQAEGQTSVSHPELVKLAKQYREDPSLLTQEGI